VRGGQLAEALQRHKAEAAAAQGELEQALGEENAKLKERLFVVGQRADARQQRADTRIAELEAENRKVRV
jgi:hypothetical protein